MRCISSKRVSMAPKLFRLICGNFSTNYKKNKKNSIVQYFMYFVFVFFSLSFHATIIGIVLPENIVPHTNTNIITCRCVYMYAMRSCSNALRRSIVLSSTKRCHTEFKYNLSPFLHISCLCLTLEMLPGTC